MKPPPDNLAPVITLLGSGTLFRTRDGAEGMLDTVFVSSGEYADPGATALDLVPALPNQPPVSVDISSSVVVVGADSVDLSRPTPPERPAVVTYDVVDAAGNKAANHSAASPTSARGSCSMSSGKRAAPASRTSRK